MIIVKTFCCVVANVEGCRHSEVEDEMLTMRPSGSKGYSTHAHTLTESTMELIDNLCQHFYFNSSF